MGFVVKDRPLVAYPISVAVYDENGEQIAIEFVAQYRRAPQQELVDLNDQISNHSRVLSGLAPITGGEGREIEPWPYATDVDFIADKMVGWRGVDDESGTAKPFTADTLQEVLSAYPELVPALFRGFFLAHQGAREKN